MSDQQSASHEFESYESKYVADVPEYLSLKQAVDIAMENNLDAKIAEQDFIVSLTDVDLQKFNALPTITAKRDFLKRNNFAASSSISAETGVQSLEPSISSDRSSRATALELNWELVDAAINIYRSGSTKDQSKIAQERYRKVVHNIILDVHSAYYKLATLQQYGAENEKLIRESERNLSSLELARKNGDIKYDQIDNLEKKIFELRSSLLDYQKQQKLSEIELKALLSINPKQSIHASYQELGLNGIDQVGEGEGIDAFVKHALKNRPEVKEEFLNLRMAQRNVNAEILSSIPGFSILVGANNDDNSFLREHDWFNLTATISQSITSLLTLPARYKKSKQELNLADARRKALIAAVVFQVHIAYTGLEDAYNVLKNEQRLFKVMDGAEKRKSVMAEAGLISQLQHFVSRADFQNERIKRDYALVDYLLSKQRLKYSVGDFAFDAYKGVEKSHFEGVAVR